MNEGQMPLALDRLSEYVSNNAGMDYDARSSADVSRVDFAIDFILERSQLIPTILRTARNRIGNYDRILWNDTTAVFQPCGKLPSMRSRLYSKEHEVMSRKHTPYERANSSGILRFEHSLIKPRAVTAMRKEFGLPNRKANIVATDDVIERVLRTTLSLCGLDAVLSKLERNIEPHEQLIKAYGGTKARHLIGFLSLLNLFGADFYRLPFLQSKEQHTMQISKLVKKPGVIQLSNTVGPSLEF
ncbi:MAG: hypothetical protein IPK98_15455 [Chloracidobacterium sp.]|nr:hypothetical protein [Chloracidobacterium sp.]